MVEHSSPPVEVDDVELVEAVRRGDNDAFTELVNRHGHKIYRLARRITNNDQDAEDTLQEAFLKAYSRLDQFQGNSKFYTWLVRITVNEALMKIRRRKDGRFVSLDEDQATEDGSMPRDVASGDEDPEQSYNREEQREFLEAAIDSLPETYRTVFVLRDVEDLSTEETAQLLDLSISAVKSRLLRARLQLRDKLKRRLGSHGF